MLTIHLLGRFALFQDDEPLALPSRPAQSLLAWLVLHPGVDHRREEIAGLLWPEHSEKKAHDNLRHVLWRLRRAVKAKYVTGDRIAIRWSAGGNWRLDVNALTATTADAASADVMIAALQAYGGELLPGFYDEWVIRERERLAALYDDRVARLLELLVTEERWRETIEWAEKWIAHGRTPEPAYRSLMQAHAHLGNTAAALTAFQRCAEALDRELGVPPAAETVQLYETLQNGQWTLDKPHPPASAPNPVIIQSPYQPANHSNLPSPTTPLIGREKELDTLAALLADPVHRLVTILGPGGVGKTKLALAVGLAAWADFPDGAFWVELTSLSSIEEIPRAIGNALNVPFQNDPRPLRQQLTDYLAGRSLLLLLDNFEHLLDGANFLVEMLEAAPGLRLLVTSRERLHLQTESIFRLDGLAYPADERQAATNDSFAALDLFAQCAGRVRQDAAPTDGDWRAIARICRAVAGMPLGIVLAAGWAGTLSPAEIAEEVAADVSFLAQELQDLDPRHRAITAVFEQSWQRLSAEEQQALAALSIFRGNIDRRAAQAVAAATLPLLARLLDRSLLWRVGEGRYGLHELVRQLAQQKLMDAGHEETMRALHSRWFLALVSRQEPRLKGGEGKQAIELLEREQENVRAAWEWAAQNGELGLLQKAIEAFGNFHNRPGQWQEGEALMAWTATVLEERAGEQKMLLLAWLWAWNGLFLSRTGQVALAQKRMAQALAILEEIPPTGVGYGVRLVRAFVYLHRSGYLMDNRRRDALAMDWQWAVEVYEEVGDLWWLTRAQLLLGHLEFYNGQVRQAEQRYMTSRRIAQQTGDQEGLAQALDQLSFMAEYAGRFSEAEKIAQERSRLLDKQPNNFIDLSQRLVWVSICLGQFEDALEAATKIVSQAQSMGIAMEYLHFSLNTLARAHLHLGHFEKAQNLAASTAELWANVHGWQQPFIVRSMGLAALGLGKHKKAQQVLSNVRADQQQMGNDNIVAVSGALVDEAYPFVALGNQAQARHCVTEGLRLVQRIGTYRFTIQALPAVAVLLAADERLEDTAYVYGLVQRYPYLTNSRWYATVALERLAQMVGSVTPAPSALQGDPTADLPAINTEMLGLLAGD